MCIPELLALFHEDVHTISCDTPGISTYGVWPHSSTYHLVIFFMPGWYYIISCCVYHILKLPSLFAACFF